MKAYGKDGHPQAKERGLRGNLLRHLDLRGLEALELGDKFLLFKVLPRQLGGS